MKKLEKQKRRRVKYQLPNTHGGRDEGGTSASYKSDSTSVPI